MNERCEVEWIPPPGLDTGQNRINYYHRPERLLRPPEEPDLWSENDDSATDNAEAADNPATDDPETGAPPPDDPGEPGGPAPPDNHVA